MELLVDKAPVEIDTAPNAQRAALIEETLGPFLAPRYMVLSAGSRGASQYLLPQDLAVRFVNRSARRVEEGLHQKIVRTPVTQTPGGNSRRRSRGG